MMGLMHQTETLISEGKITKTKLKTGKSGLKSNNHKMTNPIWSEFQAIHPKIKSAKTDALRIETLRFVRTGFWAYFWIKKGLNHKIHAAI